MCISRLDERDLPLTDLWRLTLATGLAGLVTLLNPYGWRLHQEIFDSLANQFMVETLQEWQPPSLETLAGRLFGVYLGGLTIAAVLWYRRFEPVRMGLILAFLFVACRHLRNIPLFLIVSLPLAVELLQIGFDRFVSILRLRQRRSAQWTMSMTAALALLLVFLGPDHLRNVWRFGVNPTSHFAGRPIRLKPSSGFAPIVTAWVPDRSMTINMAAFYCGSCRDSRRLSTGGCRPGGSGIGGFSKTTSTSSRPGSSDGSPRQIRH